MKIFGALVMCLHVSSPNSETKDCEKGVIGSNLCHDAKWKQYNDANKKKYGSASQSSDCYKDSKNGLAPNRKKQGNNNIKEDTKELTNAITVLILEN